MGAWGFGIWENDSALDTRDALENNCKYVGVRGQETKMIEIMLEAEDNREEDVLALLDMYMEHGGKFEGEVLELYEATITRERSEERLRQWTEPEKRMEALDEWGRKVEEYRNSKKG